MHSDSLDALTRNPQSRLRPLAPDAVRQLGVDIVVMPYSAFVYLSSSRAWSTAQGLWVDNADALRGVARRRAEI